MVLVLQSPEWVLFNIETAKGVQTQRCEQRRGVLAGSVSLCHHVKEPRWVPPLRPHLCNSSRLSPILNGPWEFLTTILLAPLQRTPWPALKALFHRRTSKQMTPAAFIRMMYERETGNDKLSQVDWLWVIFVIWSGVVDIEIVSCFSVCIKILQDTNFYWVVISEKFISVVCDRNQFVVFYFSTSRQFQHIVLYLFQHTPKNQNLNFHDVCFHPAVEAFMAPTFGNGFMSLSFLRHFSHLQNIFCSPLLQMTQLGS